MLADDDKTGSPAETPIDDASDNPVEATEASVEDTSFGNTNSECALDVATDSNASQISRARYVHRMCLF